MTSSPPSSEARTRRRARSVSPDDHSAPRLVAGGPPSNLTAFIADVEAMVPANESEQKLQDTVRLISHYVRRAVDRKIVTADDAPMLVVDIFYASCSGYNEDKGKFSTYVGRVASLAVYDRRYRETPLVRESHGAREVCAQISVHRARYEAETGLRPTIDELASDLGLTRDRVIELTTRRRAIESSIPAQGLATKDDAGALGVRDKRAESPLETAARREEIDAVAEALDHLPERSRDVLLRHCRGETFARIARIHGIGQEWARRIRDQAVDAVRNRLPLDMETHP